MRRRAQQVGGRGVHEAARSQRAARAAQLEFALQQAGRAGRIARPGVADRQRRGIRHAAHAQAGEAGEGASRIAQPARRHAAVAPQGGDGGGIVGRAEHRGAGDQRVGPGRERRGAVGGAMPPSTASGIGRPVRVDHAAQRGDLGELRGQEALAAEAGVDRHDQHDLDHVEHPLDGLRRRRRVQHNPGALAVRGDELERAVQVRAGLRMDSGCDRRRPRRRPRCRDRPGRS